MYNIAFHIQNVLYLSVIGSQVVLVKLLKYQFIRTDMLHICELTGINRMPPALQTTYPQ